jgi:hypothetical protein
MLLLCFSVSVVGHLYAQRFPTNNISQEQAIKIASCLWPGMSSAQVEQAVDKRHGLQYGANIGSQFTGWTRFYLLSNDCCLDLNFDLKGQVDPQGRGTNIFLRACLKNHF